MQFRLDLSGEVAKLKALSANLAVIQRILDGEPKPEVEPVIEHPMDRRQQR